MPKVSHDDGFTLTELLVATTITLLLAGSALTTFKNSLAINDSAAQLADANQNLRAGTNLLIRDLMQAGRVIGTQGIDMPTGGVAPFTRPGPPGSSLSFSLVVDDNTTLNLPSITPGYQLGPTINGTTTDMVTIMTVDEFMPVITTPPAGVSPTTEGTIAPDGSSITLPTTSLWLVGDPANDTPPLNVGDLVLFKNPNGLAIQTVTSKDTTHIYFAANDYFQFNQRTAAQVPVILMKDVPNPASVWAVGTSLFRALMITYHVDNVTVPGTPRLVRQVNNFAPQALAGVVEDLALTYDLVDGINNPTNVTSLPYTDSTSGVTYNSNEIRKVNIHVGVRSETLSKPAQDYVRNHMSTAVDVRSLASVVRYATQ